MELAIVVLLGASVGAAFEALRPAAPLEGEARGIGGRRRRPNLRPSYDLPPIVTNLGAPQDTWIRLEGSIIFDPKTLPHPEAIAGQIGDDILAYLQDRLAAASSRGRSGSRTSARTSRSGRRSAAAERCASS